MITGQRFAQTVMRYLEDTFGVQGVYRKRDIENTVGDVFDQVFTKWKPPYNPPDGYQCLILQPFHWQCARWSNQGQGWWLVHTCQFVKHSDDLKFAPLPVEQAQER